MISLKQLRYFSAVARLSHFGKAAQFCNVTQPALSMQVRELEAALGLKLFERHPRGVRLTEAGHDIAARARKIMADVQDLDDYARQRSGDMAGRLRLGVIPSLAPYILPPLLPELRASYPDLDLRIRETQTEALVEELIEGELDVLLLALPIDHPEVASMSIFEDRFLLAAPKGWRNLRGATDAIAAARVVNAVSGSQKVEDQKRRQRGISKARADDRIGADLLDGDKLLLLEEGHCLRDQALAFCSLRQFSNLDTFGASSLSTIVQMVTNGMGLTLLPETSLAVEARHQDFDLMRFEPPEPSRDVGLAWRKSSPRTVDFEALGKAVAQVGKDLAKTLAQDPALHATV